MIALKMLEIKSFMGQLLIRDVFDNFLLSDLEIQTANQFKINGRLNKKWFDEGEKEDIGEREYARWKEIKPFAYEIIKGNRTPESMKIIFLLSRENTQKVVERCGGKFSLDDVDGLFLNVRYENGILNLITGSSLKTFTMDKSLEQEWDKNMQDYLRHFQIPFEL